MGGMEIKKQILLILFSIFFSIIASGTAFADDPTLKEAIDNYNLDVDTSGANGNIWFAESTTSYYGSDAAQSGDISESETTQMNTVVQGPGTLIFYWKVSSEYNYDFLTFRDNGIALQSISGEVDWTYQTYSLGAGTHTLEWTYAKDGSQSVGSDCGWVDWVYWSPTVTATLPEALDNFNLDFGYSGDGYWYGQSTTVFLTDDAAQSGEISNSQSSVMSTTVQGPGTFSFDWKVSCEYYYDQLRFLDNGSIIYSISGEQNWTPVTYTITTPGSHTLSWEYIKDSIISNGSDCGWVDWVYWSPTVTATIPEAVDNNYLDFYASGNNNWYGQSSTTYLADDAAQSGEISNSQSSVMSTTVQGPGTFSFDWKVSCEYYYDQLRFLDNGSIIYSISGEQDWAPVTYTITTPGTHTLSWEYIKDGIISNGSDCGWVDWVVWTPDSTATLPEALDTSLYIGTGYHGWYGQSSTSYFGGDAAQSGEITNSDYSQMWIVVQGPGTFTFYWKVSSEANCDYLRFMDDISVIYYISGEQDWAPVTYTITTPGSHTLTWEYIKDNSVSLGSDCGWVDKVTWTPSTISLAEALDNSQLIWDSYGSSGSSVWFGQLIQNYDGSDAAQSGDLSDNEISVLRTNVDGPGIISFYWKVSSDPNDKLYFLDDYYTLSQISGETGWQYQSYFLDDGYHTLEWRYVKDGSVSIGSDCGWVDWVVWTPISLQDALDNQSLLFGTAGVSSWYGQYAVNHDGSDAAQSGDANDDAYCPLWTSVEGPGTISFWWKVSSQPTFDKFTFSDNGSVLNTISGEVDWTYQSYYLGAGTHNLDWDYTKDGSISVGSDCAWLDQVTWTPGETGNVLLVRTGTYFDTIQEAVDQSISGDTLQVNDGIYTENVLVDKNLTIQAMGAVTVQALNPNLSVFTINSSGWGSSIDGFTITGATNAFGVYLNSTNNCHITDNAISSNFMGVYIQNGNTNTISGNTILNNGWLGIGVDNSTGNIINGSNNISGNVEGVYLVNSANGNIISGNNITNNNDAGIIILNGSTSNNISGNPAITNNGLIGVLIRDSDTNTISGNNIQGNGWSGLALDNADDNNINGGNFIIANQEGINLTNSSEDNTISGNTITGNTNIGISFINNSSVNEIIDNVAISNNGIIGVYLRDSGFNIISNNNIQINSWAGVCFDNSICNTINSSNNISGNLEGLYIVNNSNSNTITGNNIHDNQDTGIYIDGSTNNQITSNTAISNNGVIGILARNANGNTISGNTVAGNTFAGIALDNADSNNINGLNTVSGSQMGVYVVNTSNGNTINNNALQNNTWAGIVLDGATNTIVYQNNFISNPLQALAQNGSSNAFYQANTGNYWSDWSSTNPRPIYGNENLIDQHPSTSTF